MKTLFTASLIALLLTGNVGRAQTQTPTVQQSTSTANTRQNATVKKTSLRQRMKEEAKQNGGSATRKRQKMMADTLKRG